MLAHTPIRSGAQAPFDPVRLTGLTLQSATQMYTMNLCTLSAMFKTQARAATAFGMPDYSALLDRTHEQTRRLLAESAQQFLDTAQHAGEVAGELQRQVGRVIETQAAQFVETWQFGLREVGAQACESLNQFRDAARQNADEASRSVEWLGRSQRETLHQAREELLLEVRKATEDARKALERTAQRLREEIATSGASSLGAAPVERADPEGAARRGWGPALKH